MYERSIASLTKGLHPAVGSTHNLMIFLLRLKVLKDKSVRTDEIDAFTERWMKRAEQQWNLRLCINRG